MFRGKHYPKLYDQLALTGCRFGSAKYRNTDESCINKKHVLRSVVKANFVVSSCIACISISNSNVQHLFIVGLKFKCSIP
jgi:hypothetical protein